MVFFKGFFFLSMCSNDTVVRNIDRNRNNIKSKILSRLQIALLPCLGRIIPSSFIFALLERYHLSLKMNYHDNTSLSPHGDLSLHLIVG